MVTLSPSWWRSFRAQRMASLSLIPHSLCKAKSDCDEHFINTSYLLSFKDIGAVSIKHILLFSMLACRRHSQSSGLPGTQ